MVFWVYFQIMVMGFLGCVEGGHNLAPASVNMYRGGLEYAHTVSAESNLGDSGNECMSVLDLFRARKYKEAYYELSEIHSTVKDCLHFMLSFLSRLLLLPFLLVATLFLLSANPRLATMFCEKPGKREVLPTLKAMMTVALLFYLLPHFAFNPFSKNYIEKVCVSVYLYNEPVGTVQQYYFLGFIALFLTPIYYMKRNQIPIRPLFVVNLKNLKAIIKYFLIGALGWISLTIIIYMIHLHAGNIVTTPAGARHVLHVRNPYLDAIYANNNYPLRLYVVAIGPFFEEICSRGMVFLLLRKHFKSYISIIFSALFFLVAPSHMVTLTAMTGAFGTGILYAYLVHKTNSLWPSLLLHAAWNATLFL